MLGIPALQLLLHLSADKKHHTSAVCWKCLQSTSVPTVVKHLNDTGTVMTVTQNSCLLWSKSSERNWQKPTWSEMLPGNAAQLLLWRVPSKPLLPSPKYYLKYCEIRSKTVLWIFSKYIFVNWSEILENVYDVWKNCEILYISCNTITPVFIRLQPQCFSCLTILYTLLYSTSLQIHCLCSLFYLTQTRTHY